VVEFQQAIGSLEGGLLEALVELIDHLQHLLVVGDILWGLGVDLRLCGLGVVAEMGSHAWLGGAEFIPDRPAVGGWVPLRRVNDVAHRRMRGRL